MLALNLTIGCFASVFLYAYDQSFTLQVLCYLGDMVKLDHLYTRSWDLILCVCVSFCFLFHDKS